MHFPFVAQQKWTTGLTELRTPAFGI